MTGTRALIAAALFLAAVCARICWPPAEDLLPAVRERIDRNTFALPLPAEAAAWLDWS